MNDTNEKLAWEYAVRSQGYTGTYQQWLAMGPDDRAEYELGAAGIPTVCSHA